MVSASSHKSGDIHDDFEKINGSVIEEEDL